MLSSHLVHPDNSRSTHFRFSSVYYQLVLCGQPNTLSHRRRDESSDRGRKNMLRRQMTNEYYR